MDRLISFIRNLVSEANNITPMGIAALALLIALSVIWLKREKN